MPQNPQTCIHVCYIQYIVPPRTTPNASLLNNKIKWKFQFVKIATRFNFRMHTFQKISSGTTYAYCKSRGLEITKNPRASHHWYCTMYCKCAHTVLWGSVAHDSCVERETRARLELIKSRALQKIQHIKVWNVHVYVHTKLLMFIANCMFACYS